ncbi:MAG: hypothetical protein AAFX54_01930 [Pseudomonadota bacterium]
MDAPYEISRFILENKYSWLAIFAGLSPALLHGLFVRKQNVRFTINVAILYYALGILLPFAGPIFIDTQAYLGAPEESLPSKFPVLWQLYALLPLLFFSSIIGYPSSAHINAS